LSDISIASAPPGESPAMAVNLPRAEDVLESLTRVVEPTYGINIVDLGLVYGIEVVDDVATVQMTLTSPDSPARSTLPAAIDVILRRRHAGLTQVNVEFVWEPAWREDFMTGEGERQLDAPIWPTDPAGNGPATADDVRESLKLVIDPEIALNIVDLGLVYGVDVDDAGVRIVMTLTTRGCPLHATIEAAIERVLETRHPDLPEIDVELVWEPPWDTDRISMAGRQQLGW
jgi:metal-sulfur cluster biosynthetic enzyme